MSQIDQKVSQNILGKEEIESWLAEAALYEEAENSLPDTIHKMSQNVTTLLATLELAQLSGEMPSEDVEVMLDNARQLRQHLVLLRTSNQS